LAICRPHPNPTPLTRNEPNERRRPEALPQSGRAIRLMGQGFKAVGGSGEWDWGLLGG